MRALLQASLMSLWSQVPYTCKSALHPSGQQCCIPASTCHGQETFLRCPLHAPSTADRHAHACFIQVLDSIQADAPYDQVVYLGDGSGDFCPCMRLRSSDYIVARECYPTGAHDSTLSLHSFEVTDAVSRIWMQARSGLPWKVLCSLMTYLHAR